MDTVSYGHKIDVFPVSFLWPVLTLATTRLIVTMQTEKKDITQPVTSTTNNNIQSANLWNIQQSN